MQCNGLPSVCTGQFMYGFSYDMNQSKENVMKRITQDLKDKKKAWKGSKIVLVTAMVTGQQKYARDALIANGFKVATEAFNYKYPEMSKTLTLLYYDVNDYKEEVKATSAPTGAVFGAPQERVVNRGRIRAEEFLDQIHGLPFRYSWVGEPKRGVWYQAKGATPLNRHVLIRAVIRNQQTGALRVTPSAHVGGFLWQFGNLSGDDVVAFRLA